MKNALAAWQERFLYLNRKASNDWFAMSQSLRVKSDIV